MFRFELIHQSRRSRARVGRIHTPHGVIETPNFVPVGTNACVKSLTGPIVDELDVQLLFANTYHLMVQPGEDTVAKMGGIHSFMKRDKPIITDSGGFQVFSLAYGGVAQEIKSKGTKSGASSIIRIREEGVWFRSYRDGREIVLTPEISIQAQKKIGADIIVSFDELPPYHTTPRRLRSSLDRTHRWELRSLTEHKKNVQQQALYAVIHGGVDPQLRSESVQLLRSHDFDGYAIGGSVGKNQTEMIDMLQLLMPQMPEHAPNHLLGIGDIPSIHACIPLGIDTFDSSHPTKCARHGLLFTNTEMVRIKKSAYAQDMLPIDPTCDCSTCTTYSRAYIHHLFKAHELTAYSLASIHNVAYMVRLMKRYREMILEGDI